MADASMGVGRTQTSSMWHLDFSVTVGTWESQLNSLSLILHIYKTKVVLIPKTAGVHEIKVAFYMKGL